MRTDKIIRYIISQTVKVRKYDVDIEKLKSTLKTHKKMSGLSNYDISQILQLPVTKVSHWFRNDEYFTIPDAEYWKSIKSLLSIDTDEFDLSILTFEEKEGVYDMSNRVYDSNGIAPTITGVCKNIKILVEDGE